MCKSAGVHHVIIPPAEAQRIVAGMKKAYVRACVCRAQEKKCPRDTWEVCLLFEGASVEDLRSARAIPIDAALSILKVSAERRMINLLFYTPEGQRATEICSCCTCCCHPLRQMKQEGKYGEEPRSGYVAVTDLGRCTGCGACVDSCFFEARRIERGQLYLLGERCFGCGRCLASCAERAIVLQVQAGRGRAASIRQHIRLLEAESHAHQVHPAGID